MNGLEDLDIKITFTISHKLTDALREIYEETDIQDETEEEMIKIIKEGLLDDIIQEIYHFADNSDLIKNYIEFEVK